VKSTVFDIVHPVVSALYFVAVFCFVMLAFQPVYIVVGLIAAFAYSVYLRGVHSACASLAWQVPLVLIVGIANPIISPLGQTYLFNLGPFEIYAESLAYGLCMGAMLASVMMWFSCATRIVTSDKLMMLTGHFMPIIGLMLSMIGRLVPQYVMRGKAIAGVQNMNTCAMSDSASSADAKKQGKIRQSMRQMSVLMGWSMEDSLDTADAMCARGWGACTKRSTYARYRFRGFDALILGCLIVLIALNIFLAAVAVSQYSFYPTLPELVVWWGYIPYGCLVFAPLIAQALSWLRWRR